MQTIIEAGRSAAAHNSHGGGGFQNKNLRNAYECKECGAYIITVDRDPGVTPFLTRCGVCDGFAQSKMYRVAPRLVPTHEWYRPELDADVPSYARDHVSRGGLLLRQIPGSPGWQLPS